MHWSYIHAALLVPPSRSVVVCTYAKRNVMRSPVRGWSEWRVSNPRPPDPKSGALPTELHPDKGPEAGDGQPPGASKNFDVVRFMLYVDSRIQ